MNYSKILVALDKSNYSDHIFQQALNIADQENTTLILFHCLSVDTGNSAPYGNIYGQELINFSISDHLEDEIKSVENWLKNYAEKAKEKGIKCEYLWKIGEPSSWVREIASSSEVDLVIIGRRGLSGIAEFFLGSVSNHVIHHVNCSVLVVQKTVNN